MVLAELADYERRSVAASGEQAPAGYEVKPVRWIVELDGNGNPVGGSLALALTSQSSGDVRGRDRDRGKATLVPSARRSRETRPILLADNGEYVFGLTRKADGRGRAKERHKAFVDLVKEAAAATGAPEVRAVVRFLESLGDNSPPQLPTGFDAEDTVAFRVDGRLVTDLPAVRDFWGRRFEQAAQLSARMRGSRAPQGLVAQCLACGQARPIAATHPVQISGVPGGRASLVSFNAEAFESYGLGQSYNAPVCVDCAQSYARGLNRLLAGEDTHLRLGNVSYVFWVREPTGRSPPIRRMFSEPRPEEVRSLILAATEGGAAGTRPEGLRPRAQAFYAAAFTNHQGRAVMLSWLETTVEAAVRNLARYFRLQVLPARYANQPPFFSLYQLVSSLLPTRRRRRGERSELDARALVALVDGALQGGPLPDWLLFQAVRRNRAEQDVPPARAALVQLVYASQDDSSTEREDVLDTRTRESPAFRCGRLLAVLERAQREAIGNPNQTLVDRFYGSASSAPCSVFGTLLRNAQPHLAKLRREKRGLHIAIQRDLEEILFGLESFPQVLPLKDQAVFALGYYYQRAARGRGQPSASETQDVQPIPGTQEETA